MKVDNLYENTRVRESPHLLCQRTRLEERDVLERLIRVNQAYKTNLQHAINTKDQDFNILEQFNRMDFEQPWDSHTSAFDCELSFTWLDWRIQDTVNGHNFRISDIDYEQSI